VPTFHLQVTAPRVLAVFGVRPAVVDRPVPSHTAMLQRASGNVVACAVA